MSCRQARWIMPPSQHTWLVARRCLASCSQADCVPATAGVLCVRSDQEVVGGVGVRASFARTR